MRETEVAWQLTKNFIELKHDYEKVWNHWRRNYYLLIKNAEAWIQPTKRSTDHEWESRRTLLYRDRLYSLQCPWWLSIANSLTSGLQSKELLLQLTHELRTRPTRIPWVEGSTREREISFPYWCPRRGLYACRWRKSYRTPNVFHFFKSATLYAEESILGQSIANGLFIESVIKFCKPLIPKGL